MDKKKKILLIAIAAVLVVAIALVLIFTLGNNKGDEPTAPELNAGDANCIHNYGRWDDHTEASCTTAGLQLRQCTKCGKQESREVAAFGHVFDDGECEDCGRKERDCDHDDTVQVVITQPTCTEPGEKRDICTKCMAATRIRATAPTGHGSTTEKLISEPTCEDDGMKYLICDTCGEVAEEITLWAEGHNYDWVDYKEPTCLENGYDSHYACSKCGYKDYYYEYEALGHDYDLGVCSRCEAVDVSYVIMTAPSTELNFYPDNSENGVVYTAGNVYVESFSGNVSYSGEKDNHYFNVETEGRYLIWIDGMANANVELYLFNNQDWITRDTYAYNGDMIYATLTPGEYYVQVRYDYDVTDYNIYLAYQKAYVDLTNVDTVVDSMEYNDQTNIYTFTAAEDGYYFFQLNDLAEECEMCLYIYDSYGSRLDYETWCDNGDGITAYFTAGETYRIIVVNEYSDVTGYSMTVHTPQQPINLDGYTSVNGNIFYAYQENRYTFTAQNSQCTMFVNGLESVVEMYLYDSQGNMVYSNTYCQNNKGIECSDLVVGEVYTVTVNYYYYHTPYTLHVMYPREAVEVTDNCGVEDTITFPGQINVYHLTVSEYSNLMVEMYFGENSEAYWLDVSIYNAAGDYINGASLYDGDYLRLYELIEGEEYYIYVEYYNRTAEYTLSFTHEPVE